MPAPPVTITCAALVGVQAIPVTLEVTLRIADAEKPRLLGRVDAAIREAYPRILSAFRAQELPAPRGAALLNFAPAEVPKRGSGFDLAMALGLAGAAGAIPREHLTGVAAFGEVSLGGEVLPSRGAVAITLAARDAGCGTVLCSSADAATAALVCGVTVFAIPDLRTAIAFLCGLHRLEPAQPAAPATVNTVHDLADIRGHDTPKLALAVAAAGRHNLLLVGPPGSGKSALVRRMAGLLPATTRAEALDILKIHTASRRGATAREAVAWLGQRPLRAPHHTSSTASVIGGGAEPRAGECTLAHHGILFLDELPEFRRETLEALRQPLEDGHVTVGRVAATVRMPADFQLVAAMNPCPCGYTGHPHRPCRCSAARAMQYRHRISGPLLDRLDLQVEVPALDPQVLRGPRDPSQSTAAWTARVATAIDRQRFRQREIGSTAANGRLEGRALDRAVAPSEAVLNALDRLLRDHRLSGRARVRLLRIARTVADLEDREVVLPEDVLEAGRLRGWDRSEG